MNSTPSSTPSQGTQLVGWPLQAGLARTEFSQFFSFTGTVQSTSDVWCGRLLKMTLMLRKEPLDRPKTLSIYQHPSTINSNATVGRSVILGYARISTDDQNLDLQRDALLKAGCERVFEDTASGSKTERTGLAALLASLRKGDTVVIWRLDRLGRSLKDLIGLVERLDATGVGLRSVQENIDTASIGGRLVFHLFGALAEFERNLIRERTQAGLSAARARGRKGGRKKRLDPAKREVALRLYRERKHTIAEICRMMGVGRSTLYNYITEADSRVLQSA